MTAKISIGNGRFCYSGPTCRLHGQAQIDTARNNLIQARNACDNAKTPEAMLEAQMKVASAAAAYDATSEGLSTLREAYEDETDSFRKLEYQVRLHRAEEIVKRFEKEEEKKALVEFNQIADGLVSVNFAKNHTYEEPTFNTPNAGQMYAPTVGSKYNGYRNVTEIAKDVRADLKEAVAKNYLPRGLKYSVTVDKYSGGASLRVVIQNTKDEEMLEKDRWDERTIFSDKAKMLKSRVGKIVDAYNSRASYPEVDYSNNLYYSNVSIEEERQRKFRVGEAAKAKRKRDQKGLRESFVKDYQANPLKALSTIDFKEFNVNNQRSTVGRIPNSHVWVAVAKRPNGREHVFAYDFSDISDERADEVSESVAKNIFRNRGLASRNFLP